MKNAIATFIKDHPFMTFFIVTSACSEARCAIVGIARAITGKYPPEKMDINVNGLEEEKEPETTVLEGDISETDSFLD